MHFSAKFSTVITASTHSLIRTYDAEQAVGRLLWHRRREGAEGSPSQTADRQRARRRVDSSQCPKGFGRWHENVTCIARRVDFEVSLWHTPPPPPPTIEAIEPDIRGATTIREQLAKHREHESCNRCHQKIDPPGFALESFDVIGAQRDWYRTRGNGKYVKRPRHPQAPNHHVLYRQGPDVDPSGVMPDGRRFSDIRDYKRLLLEDSTAMPRSLTRLLLTYSLGRQLGFSDRPEVERIVTSVKARNYGLRSLIHEIVQSKTFRQP